MTDRIFISTTGNGLARAFEVKAGKFDVGSVLPGTNVTCLAADPLNQERVYAGSRGQGVLRSDDRGNTWRPAGMDGHFVKAVAASAVDNGVVYAGTKPARMFVSRDGGDTWAELEAFRRIPGRRLWFSPAEAPFIGYVQSIALSPADRERMVVGIEAGATVSSRDGGKTWTGHMRGSLRDCHNLCFHSLDGKWIYEAGGSGGGAAFSRDGGQTWLSPGEGLDRHYGWAVAADGVGPDVWYVSASPGPFKAHGAGDAQAYIFRHDGRRWQRLSGGLPQPLNYMPYALITEPEAPGSLYAGLSNGDIWHSDDMGDTWRQLPLTLGSIQRAMIML